MGFNTFFDLFRRRRDRAASAPPGRRIYAVGDIHGRLDLLDRLLAMIAEDDAARPPSASEIIFLGDLVDRGPNSRGVVERLLALSRSGRPVASCSAIMKRCSCAPPRAIPARFAS